MAKTEPPLDVLVLGEHPATFLAAALLRIKSKLRVLHATIPDEHVPGRLVLLNPRLFELHPLLDKLRRKLDLTAIYGLQFLADDPQTRSEHRSKSASGFVGDYNEVRAAMVKLAQDEHVELATPKVLQIHRLDERGLEVTVGRQHLRPRVLVLGGRLPSEQQRLLGLPEAWELGIVHRYTFAKFKGGNQIDLGNRPIVPMSLDLRRQLSWAWLLPHGQQIQLAVEQPLDASGNSSHTASSSADLLRHWASVLHAHQLLKDPTIPPDAIESMDLPLAGALAHEGVANRTVLIGPAGGFYSATAEDLYPCCWSAVYAADAVKKALKEPHLQDALDLYRHKWRTTLGDYLRGPQQNLRFLLPLVYRNPVMTSRLVDSILLGKSVVR